MKDGSVVMDARVLRMHSDLQRAFGENSLVAFVDFVRMARAVMDLLSITRRTGEMDRGDLLARQSLRDLLTQIEDETRDAISRS
jgi:hypothetical protein